LAAQHALPLILPVPPLTAEYPSSLNYLTSAISSGEGSLDLLQYLSDTSSLQNSSCPVDFDFFTPPDPIPRSVPTTEPSPTSSVSSGNEPHTTSQASTSNQSTSNHSLPVSASDTTADDQANRRLQRRRQQNNLSARRTRQRKLEYQHELETSIKSLEEDLDASQVRTARWQRRAEHWETVARALKGMLKQNGIEFELPEFVEEL